MPEQPTAPESPKPRRAPRAVSRNPRPPVAYRRQNLGPKPLAETAGPNPGDDLQNIKLTVAKIERPHGVRGEFQASIASDTPERLGSIKQLYVGDEAKPRRVQSARFHKDRIIYKLEGIDSPEAAKALGGLPLRILGSQAAPLKEGEYFLFQLIDNDVVDTAGTVLGTLHDILETGANEVYVVKRENAPDLLLPNIPSVVLEIDIAARRIVVNPEGFL